MFSRLSTFFVMISAILLMLTSSSLVFAEGTRTWEQSKYDDFVKGTPHGVAISSNGFLELAPAFKLEATTPSSAVWATAIGPNGEIYVATGAPARVYRIVAGAQPVAIFQPQELQVQALVVDKNGVLYAATNPDGTVYKIEKSNEPVAVTAQPESRHSASPKDALQAAGWKSFAFFDPKTKYIWALALDKAGDLYVATGDHGEIFRVTPAGEHSLFFKSDEPHIRAIAFDTQENLIAGSDGSGLIYRISPKGEGFVLYSAPKREITSLALDDSGNIYVAAAGEKHSGGNAGAITVVVPKDNQNSSPGGPIAATGPPSDSAVAINSSGSSVPGGSEIYKIAPDGSPSRLWSSRDDLAYALAFDSKGHLLAGTGNQGEVYEIRGRNEYAELVKAGANQVTAFAKAPAGLYVSTSNLGKIFLLSDAPDAEGSYESDVFDAHVFSKWGRAELRGRGNVELFARSGNVDNPDRNWSVWKKVDVAKDPELAVPPARFAQWKAILHPGATPPRVDSVTLNYLPKNVAAEFDDVSVNVGTRYQVPPRPPNFEAGQRFDPQPNAVRDRQSIGVKWNVHDENDDQLVYSVYYRGDGQSRWLLLKENVAEKFYSFDASLLPDGGYTIKVLASDAPSHSPQDALSSEKESDRFEVDTTPPQIEDLKALLQGTSVRVQFRAVDGFSPIKRAEYSMDAGDWHFIEPVGRLSDAKSENYDFVVPLKGDAASAQEHVVVVRAYDRFDNMNAAKTVIGK
jgi:sugar lactone lactonase YvrE